jgi:hypothetical protein
MWQNRRDNDKKVTMLHVEMKNMMTVLFRSVCPSMVFHLSQQIHISQVKSYDELRLDCAR